MAKTPLSNHFSNVPLFSWSLHQKWQNFRQLSLLSTTKKPHQSKRTEALWKFLRLFPSRIQWFFYFRLTLVWHMVTETGHFERWCAAYLKFFVQRGLLFWWANFNFKEALSLCADETHVVFRGSVKASLYTTTILRCRNDINSHVLYTKHLM